MSPSSPALICTLAQITRLHRRRLTRSDCDRAGDARAVRGLVALLRRTANESFDETLFRIRFAALRAKERTLRAAVSRTLSIDVSTRPREITDYAVRFLHATDLIAAALRRADAVVDPKGGRHSDLIEASRELSRLATDERVEEPLRHGATLGQFLSISNHCHDLTVIIDCDALEADLNPPGRIEVVISAPEAGADLNVLRSSWEQ